MKLSTLASTLALSLVTACVGPSLAPAEEATPQAMPAPACSTETLAVVEAWAAEKIKEDPSVTSVKYSPEKSAAIIKYVNARTDTAISADTVLVVMKDDGLVVIGFFLSGCETRAVKMSRAFFSSEMEKVFGRPS